MHRIATLNDNGNSGSSIATPSRLHKRGRGTQKLDVRRSPLGGTLKHLGIEILAEMAGIAQKIELTIRPIDSLGNTFPSIKSASSQI